MRNVPVTQTQVIIFLGPPGAGKGSQAALIKEKIDLAHISTGDLFRENISQGTPLGKKAKGSIDAGQLVPDDLVLDMLFSRVEQPDCKKGYILDGFPRNLAQAKALQKRLEDHHVVVINLSVPDQAIVDRISQRLICKSCQTPYNLLSAPPKVANQCDQCAGELYRRKDDTKEVIEKRLQVYHKETSPLIEYYKKHRVLHQIDSTQSKDEVMDAILGVLLR